MITFKEFTIKPNRQFQNEILHTQEAVLNTHQIFGDVYKPYDLNSITLTVKVGEYFNSPIIKVTYAHGETQNNDGTKWVLETNKFYETKKNLLFYNQLKLIGLI